MVAKRHHYVPQFILRRFAAEEGFLCAFDSARPERGIWSETPQNLFVRSHLYSTIEPDGRRDAKLEDDLSRIEGDAAPVVEKIIDRARSGNSPRLSAIEKRTWDRFFYLQWRRVPEWRQRIGSLDQLKAELPQYIEEFERLFRPMTDQEKAEFLSEDFQRRTFQNAHVGSLQRESDRVLAAFESRGLLVAKVPSRKSLIIGSRPVVKITTPGRSNLSDDGVEVWFPISHDILVGLGSKARKEQAIEIDVRSTRMLNEEVARQSTVIAGRSDLLIKSLSPLVATQTDRVP